MNPYEEMMEEVRRLLLPEDIFAGSLDFLLAWKHLAALRDRPAVREGGAMFPIQAMATCASMALELALKCWITLEGKEPSRSGHGFVVLLRQLSPGAQAALAARIVVDGKPCSAAGLTKMLTKCEGTFVNWRYRHEHRDLDFYEGYMAVVTRALHECLLDVHPEWRQTADRFSASEKS